MSDNYEARNLIPGVIAVLILIGIVAIGQLDFKPLRPKSPQPINYSDSTPSHIQTRLWQDPFSAVNNYERAKKSCRQIGQFWK